jgi:hypothetical protein
MSASEGEQCAFGGSAAHSALTWENLDLARRRRRDIPADSVCFMVSLLY